MASAELLFKRGVFRAVLVYTALLAISWCWLFPIAWAVSGSLKSGGEISEPILFPAHPRWSNYTEVFTLMPFWRMFFNTVFYAGCITAGQVFFCSLAGYAFARLQFPWAGHIVRAVPGHVDGAADRDGDPAVHHHADLGWTDTPWAMIVPGLVRQRVRHLPDAAVLPYPADRSRGSRDTRRLLARGRSTGGSCCRTHRPAVMVLAVLTWVNVWNDFLWPLLMIQRNSLATLTLGLVRMRGEYVARWPVMMATSMLIMLPLVIIYAIAQRSFVRGIAVTGLGG